MPSATLLGQALISGVLAGGMYGLLALGLSLSWGLLRLVNLSHFALAFLAAYLTYELGTTYHVAPWWAAAMVVPVMFVIGLAQHWLFDRFKVNELASLLITFSFAVILEVAIQLYWTADYRRFETHYSTLSIKVGAFYIPVLELVLCMVAGILATGFAEELRRQDFVRKWQLVSAVPLFQKLGSPELVSIVRALRPRNLSAGAVICRKGETGDQMFFIVEGRVSVATATPVELGAGSFFGEMALVTGEPRSATVSAATAVSLLSLHSVDFQMLSSSSPEIAEVIRNTALERRGAFERTDKPPNPD